MIRIAICDDDPKKGEAVAAYIETCMREWGVPHETQFFLESQYLYYEIEDGVLFDVLVLDIEMPIMDGIELTERVKEILPDIIIIFVTDYEKYVYESFKVQPFRFIPKKYIDIMLAPALKDAYELYIKSAGKYLIIENQAGIEKIPMCSIKYIWHREKYAYIEKTNGEQSKVRKTLKQIYEELTDSDFVWIDRGYICNLLQISRIQNGDILMTDGTRLKVSRDRLVEIKQILRKYWLDQGGKG